MTAAAAETARAAMRRGGDVFSGSLLAAGAAALFVGTLFYTRLTPELGLPALPAERAQAAADALKLGALPLGLAGGFSFLGDCLLLAASIALASRSGRAGDLDRAGWSLIAVSVALAMVFDSMIAALLFPLAHASDPAPFVAFKSWFDALFAASDVAFGFGLAAVLWTDANRREPLLPRPLAYLGLAIGAAAAISGIGYSTGLLYLPPTPFVLGLSFTFGCVILAALGVQIARRDPPVAAIGAG